MGKSSNLLKLVPFLRNAQDTHRPRNGKRRMSFAKNFKSFQIEARKQRKLKFWTDISFSSKFSRRSSSARMNLRRRIKRRRKRFQRKIKEKSLRGHQISSK